jgi:hypothetical protein
MPQILHTPINQHKAKCFMTASMKDLLLLFTHNASHLQVLDGN